MSHCEQTEQTLAWVYGELPEAEDAAHLVHLGGCAACQALVAEHESVGAMLAGVATVEQPEAPVQTGPSWVRPAMALAAAVLLAVSGALWMASPAPVVDSAPVVMASEPLPSPVPAEPVADVLPPADAGFASDIDADLDDLDANLDSLLVDLSELDDLDDLAPLEAP